MTSSRLQSTALKQSLANQIRQRIFNRRYEFGERLSEKSISEEFEVSRTPAREALMSLAAEGLVYVRPQAGTFVFQPSQHDVDQLYSLRGIFEKAAAELAMGNAPEELADHLEDIIERMEFEGRKRTNRARELDFEFHDSILRHSRNQYLVETFDTISGRLRALRGRLPISDNWINRASKEHRQMCKLFRKRDLEKLLPLIEGHIDHGRAILRERLLSDVA
jgi:DNA-binding GntR family transcriptional regulator